MNTKKSLLVFAGLLTIVFLAGLVNADMVFIPTSSNQTITSGQTSAVVSFQLSHTSAGGNYTNLVWDATTSQGNWTVLPSLTALNVNETLNLTATLSNIPSTFVGTITANIHVNNSGSPNANIPITIVVQPAVEDWKNNFCLFDKGEGSNPGDISIKINDISVTGFGNNNEVLPFDQVDVELEVKNRGNDDVNNIDVEWGLYDADKEQWVIDVSREDSVDVSSDDSTTVSFNFSIDDNMDVNLNDLDKGNHYVLYVRATGEVDNTNNDATCDSDSDKLDFVLEKDFVIIKDITVPESVSCDSQLHVTADAWNIGSRSQKDVSVKIFNKDLGISKVVQLGEIKSFKRQTIDETFDIPSSAKAQTYLLSFEVYDNNGDIFKNNYDDQEARFTKSIKVDSCSGTSSGNNNTGEGNILVSAEIQSGGEAGKPLIIKAVVTNTGDSSATLLLNAAGYSSWAESVNVVPESITLAAGKSASALFTFEVNKDATGDNMFDLEIVSGNNLVAVQPVSVSIAEGKGGFSLGGSWYLWLIVALNVILVVVIISVAVKVSKRK